MSPLKVEEVHKKYKASGKEVHAVKGVSFELKEGEIFALLGPNGAGKTSTINMITTLERLDQGRISVFGADVATNPMQVKKSLGVVHQELITHGFFNLEEILDFHSGYYGCLRNYEQIDYLLKNLGLDPHRKKMMKQLSGGMKRRMMIAKALVHKPKLLLLDEPTAGVDVELRNSLWAFVRDLKRKGVTVLLTTHYLAEAQELCDRVGIIDHGEMKYLGPTQEVITKLTKKRVEVEFRGAPQSGWESGPYFVQKISPQRMAYALPGDLAVGAFFEQAKISMSDVQDISTREGTLEEAFLSVIANKSSKEVRP